MTDKENWSSAATASRDRDGCADSLRGVCILAVVFIHTTFWSGQTYVPAYLRSASLLLDVPAFFFVSGITASITGRVDVSASAVKICTTFALLSFIYEIVNADFSFHETISAIMLQAPHLSLLPVVEGSYWFVPVFIVVQLYAAKIIKLGPILISLICSLLLGYIILSFFFNLWSPPPALRIVDPHFFAFYLFAFLLGFIFKEHAVVFEDRRKLAFLVTLPTGTLLFLLCVLWEGVGAFNLQANKFPIVTLPYASASLASFAFIMLIYGKFTKIPFLDHVGRSAIFYYAGQGVGASALLHVAPHLDDIWYIKLLQMFSLNIIITIVVSEILRILHGGIVSGISAIKPMWMR